MKKRVVITGMGIIAPNATGVNEFRNALLNSTSGLQHVDDMEKAGFKCTVGGICNVSFDDILAKFPQLNIPFLSRSTLMLVKAAHEALSMAGMEAVFNNNTTSDLDIIIGSTIGPADQWEQINALVDQNRHRRLGSNAFEQIINSSPAAMLAGLTGASGRVISNSLACASATESIVEAANKIQYENKQMVIAGGVEPYSKYYWATMDAMKIIDEKHNDKPETASRPMSASARGFITAEGCGVLIIEDYEYAVSRGAQIYAEIAGGHVNCGGMKNGGSMSSANYKKNGECIVNAIEDADISPSTIDFISGHLTGTKADPYEIQIWRNVMRDDFPYINSTKSFIGHAIGACGAIETIASVIQMNNHFIHASINCEDIHPEILKNISEDNIVRKVKHNIQIKYTAKANFGFGDVNACLILKNTDE
ncbi:MAG: beta-ketoacyl-[acyl-carrier-protein] synthase family protein [Bacteroidota bacterium]